MSKSEAPPPAPHPTGSFERGEAKYFHGRTGTLKKLKESMSLAKDAKSGTIILIQAAPGAGKSALLVECARQAREQKWMVANIEPDDLLDPEIMFRTLKKVRFEWLKRLSIGGGVKGFTAGVEFERPKKLTLQNVIKNVRTPLMLQLDEAQRLLEDITPDRGDRFTAARSFLKKVHAGECGGAVMLVAAGLGGSTEAFRQVGVSRFDGGRKIELGALERESTRAVIRDWLVNDGGVEVETTEWEEKIAEQTCDWPQHIMAYIWPAIRYLKENDKQMSAKGLNMVLEKGDKGRTEFYEARTDGIPAEHLASLAQATIAATPQGAGMRYTDIMTVLRNDFKEDAETIFTRAVQRGVLDMRKGRYMIPIPSMESWIVDTYGQGLPPRP